MLCHLVIIIQLVLADLPADAAILKGLIRANEAGGDRWSGRRFRSPV